MKKNLKLNWSKTGPKQRKLDRIISTNEIGSKTIEIRAIKIRNLDSND